MRSIYLLTIIVFLFQCKSEEKVQKSDPKRKETFEDQGPANSPTIEIEKAKEGFVSDSLFQVAVSSMAPNLDAKKEEARSIAEQRALNLLKTYAPSNLSELGRKELREISKSGYLLDKHASQGEKTFFLYQIQRKDLKRMVTSGLD